MKLNNFKLERYFAKYEFTSQYLLSASDCQSAALSKVLESIPENELLQWMNLNLGYGDSQGRSELREKISLFYNNISIDNIVVASPGELNYAFMNTLLSNKDHVVCVHPSYQSLYEVTRSIGCDLSFWKFNTTSWKFEIDELKELIRKDTKLIIINFPHNPTGSYITKIELQEIIKVAEKNDCYIFSDEMYHKLTLDDGYPELPALCTLYKKGISLWGLSKTFGLAGLRIGWLVSQDNLLVNNILYFKDYLSICNSVLSEKIAYLVLNEYQKYIDVNITTIKSNVHYFKKALINHLDILDFNTPKAGSVSMIKLKTKYNASQFSKKLLEDTEIMSLPSAVFDMEDKFIRIGFGREEFPEIINKFCDFLVKNHRI